MALKAMPNSPVRSVGLLRSGMSMLTVLLLGVDGLTLTHKKTMADEFLDVMQGGGRVRVSVESARAMTASYGIMQSTVTNPCDLDAVGANWKCICEELGRERAGSGNLSRHEVVSNPEWNACMDEKWARSSHSIADLSAQYDRIFPTGNRNAASHLWSNFILYHIWHKDGDRIIEDLTDQGFKELFEGFCPVSGSPVTPLIQTRYLHSLRLIKKEVGGLVVPDATRVQGYFYHCCWPCFCDSEDYLFVDTATVKTKDANHTYKFVVMANPCPDYDHKYPDGSELRRDAPEIQCANGKLERAVLSDNGLPIVGMFFTGNHEGAINAQETSGNELGSSDEGTGSCGARAKDGNKSGMGKIFIEVADIGVSRWKLGGSLA